MKKLAIALTLLLVAFMCHAQSNIPYQEINYDVRYHLGIIDVNIAHGTVGMQKDGDLFSATLNGHSIPWEGHVFSVSDILKARITPAEGMDRETVLYENGWYRKPKASLYGTPAYDPEDPANYKTIKGEGTLDASGNTMEAITVTADMLGLFYYFRELDFGSMAEGQQTVIPIEVVGGEPQKVVVTYEGSSQYEIGGQTHDTYDVTFEYSYNGAMSGYPVQTKVDCASRVPLLLSASLPIGKVEMICQL